MLVDSWNTFATCYISTGVTAPNARSTAGYSHLSVCVYTLCEVIPLVLARYYIIIADKLLRVVSSYITVHLCFTQLASGQY